MSPDPLLLSPISSELAKNGKMKHVTASHWQHCANTNQKTAAVPFVSGLYNQKVLTLFNFLEGAAKAIDVSKRLMKSVMFDIIVTAYGASVSC